MHSRHCTRNPRSSPCRPWCEECGSFNITSTSSGKNVCRDCGLVLTIPPRNHMYPSYWRLSDHHPIFFKGTQIGFKKERGYSFKFNRLHRLQRNALFSRHELIQCRKDFLHLKGVFEVDFGYNELHKLIQRMDRILPHGSTLKNCALLVAYAFYRISVQRGIFLSLDRLLEELGVTHALFHRLNRKVSVSPVLKSHAFRRNDPRAIPPHLGRMLGRFLDSYRLDSLGQRVRLTGKIKRFYRHFSAYPMANRTRVAFCAYLGQKALINATVAKERIPGKKSIGTIAQLFGIGFSTLYDCITRYLKKPSEASVGSEGVEHPEPSWEERSSARSEDSSSSMGSESPHSTKEQDPEDNHASELKSSAPPPLSEEKSLDRGGSTTRIVERQWDLKLINGPWSKANTSEIAFSPNLFENSGACLKAG